MLYPTPPNPQSLLYLIMYNSDSLHELSKSLPRMVTNHNFPNPGGEGGGMAMETLRSLENKGDPPGFPENR